jgi:hypothetical protein
MTMTLIQLNPPIPMSDEAGRKGIAYFLLDYGIDWETLFLIAWDDTAEWWWVSQSKLRAAKNISLGRLPQEKKHEG